jgi:hypothetical protein
VPVSNINAIDHKTSLSDLGLYYNYGMPKIYDFLNIFLNSKTYYLF